MNTSTKTISHTSLWLLVAFTIVSVVLFAGRVSFVHADDPSTSDTSGSTDSGSSDPGSSDPGGPVGGTFTGTYTDNGDGSSSLVADCSNVSDCASYTYDNNVQVFNVHTDTDTNQTTGTAYVDGQYVTVTQVDAGDGFETWAYPPLDNGGGLYPNDTGGGSSNDSSNDNNTGGTPSTNPGSPPPTTSCASFASNCGAPPPSSANAPCATANCAPPAATPPPANTPIPTPNLNPPPAAPPVPFLWIDANPHLVRSGSSSTISWGATNVQSCNVKLNGTTVYSGTSGTRDVGNITSQRVYTLECVGIGGGFTVTTAVQISIVPKWQEI